MSWSYNRKGPALEVARDIELGAEQVDRYLSMATSNPAERALHARAVSMIVAACHEGREHDVLVEAYGHFDGKHNHVTVKIDGINAPEPEPTPAPVEPVADDPAPVECAKCKPDKPCKAHR
jgi:hypothetical protein